MRYLLFGAILTLNFSVNDLMAAELQQNDYLIQAHGVIVVPPCHINNDKTIDVDFQTIGLGKLKNEVQKIETWIPILCEDDSTLYSLRITGNTLGNERSVLVTDRQGLGISLSQAATKIVLNEFFSPEDTGGINLHSQLISTQDFESVAGDFRASATMSTQYE